MGSKRPRASEGSKSLASLVPLEDMSDPRIQLELREVIIVSLRDSSLTLRTTMNILFTHSKQLLNAARDISAPLPLDCSAATMGILDDLFWAEQWENSVNALTCEVCSAVIMLAVTICKHAPLIASSSLQELLDLFEVAHAWQIDVLALRMPNWIEGRTGWRCQQLQDLHERAEVPDLAKMLALDFVAQLTCPQAGDLSTIMHQSMPQRSYDAVKYLGNAKLPMLSPHIAMDLLAQLDKLAEKCARIAGQDNQLSLWMRCSTRAHPKFHCARQSCTLLWGLSQRLVVLSLLT